MAARAVAREQEWAAVATEMEAAAGTERTVVAMDRHGIEEAGAEVAVAAAATTVGAKEVAVAAERAAAKAEAARAVVGKAGARSRPELQRLPMRAHDSRTKSR